MRIGGKKGTSRPENLAIIVWLIIGITNSYIFRMKQYHLVDDQHMTLRRTVTLVSADNLAAQAIGGYKALHSTFRKCRLCMAVDGDMQR